MTVSHEVLLILDFGSQYTQLIARRVRESEIFSKLLPGNASLSMIEALKPRAIILSGGPHSVYDPGAPQLDQGFWTWQKRAKVPVLGICYGMQLTVKDLGGEVRSATKREYGRMDVLLEKESGILGEIKSVRSHFQVWMSHGDEMENLPDGFELIARSREGSPAVIENADRRIFGLQFHPEVSHTEHGSEILKRFLFGVSKFSADWKMGPWVDEKINEIRNLVGPDEHVVCGLSGGVDSTVAAVLVHRAIGDRLHCIFVDHGLLRLKEQARVMEVFRESLHLPVECVDASADFLSALDGVTDPEQKRKIIGQKFIDVFEKSSQRIFQKTRILPTYLVQGTLYPDVVESSPAPQTVHSKVHGKFSMTIKSHHNVGGLPEKMRLKLLEPFRDLFKDEVREIGRILGVPDAFIRRHPFPGPGLAVRIMGAITPERLELLRHVDEIFIEELHRSQQYDQVWQAFAVFLPIRSVGVQGDGRTHDHVVALRAVTSRDGMTADWVPFSHEFLSHVSNRICNEVRGVNRVVYDVSSKPPATIEWE